MSTFFEVFDEEFGALAMHTDFEYKVEGKVFAFYTVKKAGEEVEYRQSKGLDSSFDWASCTDAEFIDHVHQEHEAFISDVLESAEVFFSPVLSDKEQGQLMTEIFEKFHLVRTSAGLFQQYWEVRTGGDAIRDGVSGDREILRPVPLEEIDAFLRSRGTVIERIRCLNYV